MNNQLSNIAVQYRKFSKGQPIEHTQFNEFLDFFEDQDRLSRVMLKGVGIACGIKPQLIYTSNLLSSIQLSQGVAVTTDGDLLTLNNTNKVSEDLYVSDLKTINIEHKDYTHFKVYDNHKVKYPAFHDENGDQIELWELATTKEANSDFQPIKNHRGLEDKYLLLYLEAYEKDVKPCRGVDCDNHGIQQIRNLKVLVTTKNGIDQILAKDKIQPHPLHLDNIMVHKKQERIIIEQLISEIKAERGIETVLASDLKNAYSKVVVNDNYSKTIFDKIDDISKILGISTIDRQSFINAVDDSLTQNIGFQYTYDMVKELIDTYSEIVTLLPKSFTKCLPDLLSFPKHVMLGKLISNTKLDYSRHQFYNSPILDNEKTTRRVELLIERFRQQVQNFKYSLDFENQTEIKITPSQKLNPLSNKAVPFYYNVTDDFLKVWNFDKTSNRSSNTNLGYDTNLLSPDAHIQNPVNFNIDKNSFYRIEGHQGMNYQDAFDFIKRTKDEQQLGFDIMALSLEELIGNKDLSKAYFNEYVEKHPGIEHIGGVEKGGTFAIVYESSQKTKVIADFSLPYMCCTPKATIKLSLPSSVICSKASRVPFTVFPIHGVVKADVAANLNGGVELINGQYFFNPVLVSPELRDRDISFTVNDKPTNCKVKVITQSQVVIVANPIVYPEVGSNTTTVTFSITGEYDPSYEFSWDFLGNGSYIYLNPINGIFTHTYFNLDIENIPTIQVVISGNGCSQNIVLNDWYEGPPTTINSISFPNGNCCEGTISNPTITANAGVDKTITLPTNSVALTGSGSGASTLIYSWTQTAGPTATLAGANQPNLTVSNLAEANYTFMLTVTDTNSGVFDQDEAVVMVKSRTVITKVEVEIVEASEIHTECESAMVVRVNVPPGETRIVEVTKTGTATTGGSQYSQINNADVLVYDGFSQTITETKTFGLVLNVYGYIHGQLNDFSLLTLTVKDSSGLVTGTITLKSDHNSTFDEGGHGGALVECITPASNQ